MSKLVFPGGDNGSSIKPRRSRCLLNAVGDSDESIDIGGVKRA